MPIDRAATLRNAEKLLRQGKLDAAIAEYVRIVEEQPRDWNTANVLGDLYVRAGQVDRAVEQFVRIANHLNDEGFLPKAGALYKKILKLKPEHDHALVQSAEIAASQGLLADARSYLNTVAERRRAKGDARGAAQIRIRLGNLDPNDLEGRANAARARAEIGDAAGALRDLKEIAAELAAKDRDADALDVIREAALIAPDDEELRQRLLEVYLKSGDYARARECAVTIDQLKAVAAALDAAGQPAEALQVLRDAARIDPDDAALRSHLARSFVALGDVASAAEYLTLDTAGDDPKLRQTVAEIQLRSGHIDEGLAILRQLVTEDPARREDVAMFGWSLAEQAAESGFRVVDFAADTAVAAGDWAGAAAALQEFVTRVPNHIPALMRLVEICVDGGLEATMFSAQAQLADAYLAGGAAVEARVIAEDLVAREPWERANIDRFRRALAMLGEQDPDEVIAERLSGQSPFTSTDLSFQDLPYEELSAPESEPVRQSSEATEATPPAADRTGSDSTYTSGAHFTLGPNAIDVDALLNELEPRRPAPPPQPATPPSPQPAAPPEAAAPNARRESPASPIEVDLSGVLGDIKPGGAVLPPPTHAPIQASDLEGAFAQLRAESARGGGDEAEQQYERALEARGAGRIDDAIEALRAASRSPRLRFQAASLLGRLYRERGNAQQAIEWFERAAEAPATSPGATHRLMYELADLLESIGENARALAVCIELQADAGEYGDVGARIERLSRVQARG